MDCPKDFLCVKSEFEILCKAGDNNMHQYAHCLEDDLKCQFALSFGYDTFCRCPVRVYIANNLNK